MPLPRTEELSRRAAPTVDDKTERHRLREGSTRTGFDNILHDGNFQKTGSLPIFSTYTTSTNQSL